MDILTRRRFFEGFLISQENVYHLHPGFGIFKRETQKKIVKQLWGKSYFITKMCLSSPGVFSLQMAPFRFHLKFHFRLREWGNADHVIMTLGRNQGTLKMIW